jgi:hypothetical protein
MIIPDRVIICGVENKVVYIDHYYIDNCAISGRYSDGRSTITLCRSMYTREGCSLLRTDFNTNRIIQTFFHELWHAICFSAGIDLKEDECSSSAHTEMMANLFSNIAMVNNKDLALREVFNELKTIETDISESEYRKLEYVIKHTVFEFDKLAD